MKKKQNNKKMTIISDPIKSPIYWCLWILALCILVFSSFKVGLFNGLSIYFENPIYSAIIAGGFLLAFISLYCYIYEVDLIKKFLLIFIWTIPLTYIISHQFAVSTHLSRNEILLHVFYASFFSAGIILSESRRGLQWFQKCLVGSMYLIVLFGVMNLLGMTYSKDAIMPTEQGIRLTSVFQYANAYAAVLMAALLCCLYLITSAEKKLTLFLHATMLVPILLSFLLTLSRGALVLLPIIIIIILPWLNFTRQVKSLFYLIVALIPTIFIYSSIENIGNDIITEILQRNSPSGLNIMNFPFFKGLGIILSAVLITSLLILAIECYIYPRIKGKLERLSSLKLSNIYLSGLLLVLVSISASLIFNSSKIVNLLPPTLSNRLQNVNFDQQSFVERIAFFKDAVKVVQDYPILGVGGGGWATIFEQYQSYPYISRQAHNFYLQYIIETGFVGFFFLMIFIVGVLALFIKDYIKNAEQRNDKIIFFFILITFLLHSFIDFEMSYAYIAALVFTSLGALMPKIHITTPHALKKWRYVYPSLGLIATIGIIVTSSMMLQGNHKYLSAINKANAQQPYTSVISELDEALEYQSGHPEILALKAQFLQQVYTQLHTTDLLDEINQTIITLKDKEPYSRQLIELEYSLYSIENQHDKMLELLKKSTETNPWEISFYERYISLQLELWKQTRNSLNEEALLEMARLLNEQIIKLSEVPNIQYIYLTRTFESTPTIKYALGQYYFIKGNYQKAFDELQKTAYVVSLDSNLNPNEQQVNKGIIRFYLATSRKLDSWDQSLYDKLVAFDSKEAQEVNKLIQSIPK